MALLRKINKIFDGIIGFFAFFGCILITFIVLSVTADVFMRFFFNRPISWVVEITEYMLSAFTFFAISWVLKNEGHVVLDVVINRLTARNRAALNTIISILSAGICGVIFWYGLSNMLYHFREGTMIVEKTIDLPKAPILIVLPLGFLMFFIQFLRRAHGFLRIWKGIPLEENREEGFQNAGDLTEENM